MYALMVMKMNGVGWSICMKEGCWMITYLCARTDVDVCRPLLLPLSKERKESYI